LFYVTLSLPLTSTLFPYTTLFRSLLHNALNRVEAKPCSFPHSLRGEERFEDMRPYLGQNPRTVIGDLNHDAIVLAIGSNSKLALDRKSTRLNSSHGSISYAVFCLK